MRKSCGARRTVCMCGRRPEFRATPNTVVQCGTVQYYNIDSFHSRRFTFIHFIIVHNLIVCFWSFRAASSLMVLMVRPSPLMTEVRGFESL